MSNPNSTDRISIQNLSDVEIDLEVYLSWLRNVRDNEFIESARVDYTLSELSSYLKTKLQSSNVEFWGIFLNSVEFIGTVKLEPIDFSLRTAWVGIMIGDPSQRGKGYGFSALELVSDYSARVLSLKELRLGVDKKNSGAVKMYERAGFSVTEYRDSSLIMAKYLENVTEL